MDFVSRSERFEVGKWKEAPKFSREILTDIHACCGNLYCEFYEKKGRENELRVLRASQVVEFGKSCAIYRHLSCQIIVWVC